MKPQLQEAYRRALSITQNPLAWLQQYEERDTAMRSFPRVPIPSPTQGTVCISSGLHEQNQPRCAEYALVCAQWQPSFETPEWWN